MNLRRIHSTASQFGFYKHLFGSCTDRTAQHSRPWWSDLHFSLIILIVVSTRVPGVYHLPLHSLVRFIFLVSSAPMRSPPYFVTIFLTTVAAVVSAPAPWPAVTAHLVTQSAGERPVVNQVDEAH
ncbi:hypothetical protein KM472_gp209 [Cynomolgus macaque cytomegalovirus strain Ottawa]|uniref:Uncharacterized protein n=1 Tax=macacine betaherpesvirus 8 TaxID=2560567 RepID=G8H0T8_9BETA|nr:hypothetical protein KM472_gp209 [Cynomolgus macaque cytomegalovirus strain Ottawa]AEQ32286.1 hypothetical protein cy197 [Cynomolgus macaque cytomegalovirus strain Ottawa]